MGNIEHIPIQEDDIDPIAEIHKLDFSHLPNTKADQLRQLLLKHHKVFSNKPGQCKTFEHQINLVEGFSPKRLRPYRIPEKLKPEVDKQIDELLAMGKIRASNSPFAHPIVCVAKPDGKIRMCVDLRFINSGTINDKYPTPIGDELLMRISSANVITTLDNSCGYWQIPLREEDCHKTAFTSHRGLYEFLVLPYGLKTASNTFTRVMNDILAPHHDFADAFIDDSAVFSKSWELHISHLDAVLQCFTDVGMTLKLSKCKFARESVQFLGHVVGSGLHCPIFDRVEAIRQMPEPTTKKLLRSFLGTANFYKNYVKNYSAISCHLSELTKNNYPNNLKFNDIQRKAFNDLKDALCNFTLLHSAKYDRPFILRTDASAYAIGGCLSQLDDEGTEYPIAFVSAKLSETQRKRAIIENEAWALLYSLQKLDVYVYASKNHVFMDHNPLSYIINSLATSPRLTRWSLTLQRWDLE